MFVKVIANEICELFVAQYIETVSQSQTQQNSLTVMLINEYIIII